MSSIFYSSHLPMKLFIIVAYLPEGKEIMHPGEMRTANIYASLWKCYTRRFSLFSSDMPD